MRTLLQAQNIKFADGAALQDLEPADAGADKTQAHGQPTNWLTDVNQPGGAPTLDGEGKIPLDKLPSGGGGAPAWGGITGTLADQTDLAAALALKENAADLGSAAEHDAGDFDAAGAATAAASSVQTNLNSEVARAEAAEGARLAKAQNLEDLSDASAARGNLGLGWATAQLPTGGSRTLADTTLSGSSAQIGGILNFPNPGIDVCALFWFCANVTRQSPAATTAVNLVLSVSTDGGATWTDASTYVVAVGASVSTFLPISFHTWLGLDTPAGDIQIKLSGQVMGSVTGTDSVTDGRLSAMLLPFANFTAP